MKKKLFLTVIDIGKSNIMVPSSSKCLLAALSCGGRQDGEKEQEREERGPNVTFLSGTTPPTIANILLMKNTHPFEGRTAGGPKM
jgi:hypothetical protein